MRKTMYDDYYQETEIKLADLRDENEKCGWAIVCGEGDYCTASTRHKCPKVMKCIMAKEKVKTKISDFLKDNKCNELTLSKDDDEQTENDRFWWCRWLSIKNTCGSEYVMTFRCDNYKDLWSRMVANKLSNDFLRHNSTYHDFESIGKIQFVQHKAREKKVHLLDKSESEGKIWPISPEKLVSVKTVEELLKTSIDMLLCKLNEDEFCRCYFDVDMIIWDDGYASYIAELFVKWVISLEVQEKNS